MNMHAAMCEQKMGPEIPNLESRPSLRQPTNYTVYGKGNTGQ